MEQSRQFLIQEHNFYLWNKKYRWKHISKPTLCFLNRRLVGWYFSCTTSYFVLEKCNSKKQFLASTRHARHCQKTEMDWNQGTQRYLTKSVKNRTKSCVHSFQDAQNLPNPIRFPRNEKARYFISRRCLHVSDFHTIDQTRFLKNKCVKRWFCKDHGSKWSTVTWYLLRCRYP